MTGGLTGLFGGETVAVISSIRSTPLSTSYEVYDPYQIPFVDVTGQYGFTPVWVCPEMYDPACAANDVALADSWLAPDCTEKNMEWLSPTPPLVRIPGRKR